MHNEIANQLLVQVQNEMVKNVEIVKKHLIEWLERPESGGVEFFCEQLIEVSGALFLLGRGKPAKFSQLLSENIEKLDIKFREGELDKSAFSLIGAEMASGLLLLEEYVIHLGVPAAYADEQLVASAKAIGAMVLGRDKTPFTVQNLRVDEKTYIALSAKVSEVVGVVKNQVEQYSTFRDEDNINTDALIKNNNELVGIFSILKLNAPQILLKEVNNLLLEPLTNVRWLDVAEAMLLVDGALKNYTGSANQSVVETDLDSAVSTQVGIVRDFEVRSFTRSVAKIVNSYYDSLCKLVVKDGVIKREQGWEVIASETLHFSSALRFLDSHKLDNILFMLSQIFAEISLRREYSEDAFVSVVDVLVSLGHMFSDYAETAKINQRDITFLGQAGEQLKQIYTVSSQAKSMVADFARAESVAQVVEEDLDSGQDFDSLLSGLNALDDDFDGSCEEITTEEAAPQIKEEQAVNLLAESLDTVQPEGSLQEDSSSDIFQSYFSNKSLSDLDNFSVPAEKQEFLESNADAIMDEDIRELFLEELSEKVDEIQSNLLPWVKNPDSEDCIGTIRRAFHTIKGSGRTVGYEALGECAWQHEQMLNRIIDKTFLTNAVVQEVVGDTVQLLSVLILADGFIEQKGALLTQASIAEN